MMRTILITLAAAASALAIASPASAQVTSQHYGYPPAPAYGVPGYGTGYGAPGYGSPYGHGYGFNRGHVRSLQFRVDQVQREIARLARFGMISPNEHRRLRNESRRIERAIRVNASDRFGMTPREARTIEVRIARLEQRMQHASWNRDHRWGRGDRYGRGYAYYGERDHGWERDRDDDRWDD